MKGLAEKLIGFAILAGMLFGLFVIVVAPFEMWKKAEAETWPARKGVITTSYAAPQQGGAGKRAYWKAEICGTYKDKGERFCVSRIRFGGFRFGEGRADAFDAVARYPVGREVDIHYSPDNPAETVLEARSSWKEMVVLLGLGVGALLVPVGLWAFRKKAE
jgi:hypothetical protein